ncbi:ABC transporter permease subunit [Oricola sp.]|uniref:ABC transporter permease n=1 Tax=Oricola sp. TaxID=1979950 RepID=UPI0025EC58DE|nr:ABC transporter permease subunit [Oricola sp.]MCI5076906.1 ABC transporter permease subunit [Oricola sp.]
MTALARYTVAVPGVPSLRLHHLALILALAASWALAFLDRGNPLVVVPQGWIFDLATPLTDAMKYLAREFQIGPVRFSSITRSVGWLISQPFELLAGLLADGFTFYRQDAPPFHIPALPWIGTTGVFCLVAWWYASSRLALWTGLCFAAFAVFGLWESAMLTLASVIIAVILGGFGGVVLGIWGYRKPWLNAALQPLYDTMQTLPLFSYLVPMILFFGFGPVAALMATIVFALPPMARVTTEALHALPRSVSEFGEIAGCSPFQLTWLVRVPAARNKLLLGVNQVIMLSLAVVIVASLIGAGGLGGDVLKALKSMRMGDAMASGLAITLIAITLDRLSYAIATKRPAHTATDQPWIARHALPLGCAAILAVAILISVFVPAMHQWPDELVISLGRFGNGAVQWIGATFDTQIDAVRDTAIVYLLKPVKIFFLTVPWASFVIVIGALGWILGGWRLAMLGIAIFVAIALLGYWKKAMMSLYLVSMSVVVAMIIGTLLGLWARLSDRAERVLIAFVDVLQTLPTFVYLIPVVMLFSIGDFPAFVAIILYGIAPAIRYTSAGIRGVRLNLVEGAIMSGCSRLQLLTQVKLPLALPTILLGLNQVVMMSFGMLVITALVGTRGLEETTLVAIARVAAGDGLLAGLGIAGMAIVFDRYLKALNRKIAFHLGVPIPR